MCNQARSQSRNLLTTAAAFVALSLLPCAIGAQDTASAGAPKAQYDKVLGAVVSVGSDGKSLTVKTDSGATSEVLLDPNTSYMRVAPGEKDLRKAERTELNAIEPGDRVYARIRKLDGEVHTAATSVIVMSHSELAQHQEKNRAEWQTRGVAGKVTAVDAAARTFTISVSGAGAPKDITVQTDEKTNFRRYAPDSVKFSDALPSKLADIAVGNNARVLGDKDADGTKIHAEEIVSGSFRNLAGTVISADPASNEIKINDLLTKKPVTIRVNADTTLRKLPLQMAMMIAHTRQNAPGAVAAGTPGGPRVPGGPDSKPGFNGPAPGGDRAQTPAGTPSGSDTPGSPRSMGAEGGGRPDVNRMLEHMPPFQIADLKPGDALVINSTNGADPSRVTAITVVAGVEPILQAAPPGARGAGGQSSVGGSWNLGGDIGLPQ